MKSIGRSLCKFWWGKVIIAGLALAACGGDDTGQSTGDVDDGRGDLVPFDTSTTQPDSDATQDVEIVPGGFGAPCVDNGQCDSGYCIQGQDGFICTSTCVDECPDGYGCKGVASGSADIVFVCVPNVTNFCRPCTIDNECNGGRCLPFAGGTFCTRPCDTECAQGFECTDLEDQHGNDVRACVPTSGTCDCSPSTIDAIRGCEITTPDGTCKGTQICQIEGWSTCSARIPIAEVCDFVDNDCDDKVDEGFVDDNGLYTSNENCGYCGNDCTGSIPNAQTKCDGELDPPQCVVDTCLPGFFELSPFFCAEVPAKLCNTCDDAASCVIEGATCAEFDDGKYCTAPCTNPGDCPEGYTCTPQTGGSSQCLPTSGTCVCGTTTIGLQRGCEKTYQAPGVPEVTCVGLETCAVEGWGDCVLGADICDNVDNNCDGKVDDEWVNDQGIYFKDENCGICGNNCLVNAPENATRRCDISGDVPKCVVVCEEGSADLDGNPLNGCECVKTSDTDLPDGTDQNCDGIDGEIDNGIFVAKTGNDAGAGTIDDPLLTVQAGISRAETNGKRDIYVATGVYTESVTLASGGTVYGGYSGDFHERDIVLYETALIADAPTAEAPGAVNAVGIDAASGLVGVTVFGFNADLAGQSSYAIWIVDSGSALTIAHDTIYAGDGAAGGVGVSGSSGTAGVGGVAGRAAKDIGDDTCGGSDQSLGGNGGPRTCGGADVGGGNGGTAICPDFNESSPASACPVASSQTATPAENGTGGKGVAPGTAGAAGLDVYINRKDGPYSDTVCADANANCSVCHVPLGPAVGQNGSPGAPGENGDAGEGCAVAAGSVVDNRWVAAPSTSGTDGSAGSGGGGGGAGGGVETLNCASQSVGHHDIGGSGGGGGSGGCGALGGTAGGGGGASFGIFVSWSATPTTKPNIHDNDIRPGAGGNGGNGGLGGTGGAGSAAGPGGLGGASDPLTFCAPQGGSGGQGGQGGHGGGGGGGCGGVSFGIYVAGGAGEASWKTQNTIRNTGHAGGGGVGGPSLGESGGNGQSGAAGSTNF
ncbi:MAG: hypothetical protein U1F43_13885 [Myxococcota bacterium]